MFRSAIFPKKIAIIIFAIDEETIRSQLYSLSKENFEFEFFLPFKNEKIFFESFSKLVNYSVENTKSEFMIFINPKVLLKDGDISFIIKELCSGKCFVSLVGFAFFGCTKQLFKNVGLLDERFFAGEFEDNDFLLRLKKFGKAIYFEHDLNKRYNLNKKSIYNPYRGCTTTLFYEKWNPIDNDTYCITNQDLNSFKKLNEKIDTNSLIQYTWDDFGSSYINSESHIGNKIKNSNIILIEKNKTLEYCEFDIKINIKNNFLEAEFNSFKKTTLSILIKNILDPKVYDPIINFYMPSNSWWKYQLPDIKNIELTIFNAGSLIYKNIITDDFKFEHKFKTFTYILEK